ncbi:hypothetical protein B0O99DRAFT_604926 [Bisporella sp. PMI_857]|nr:hypothetical protein B0O99DRAFT_604926 [Bisporella sp. PMI_857]
MGNILTIRAGISTDRNPIVLGSHLDTQPTGGRYDGILNVQLVLDMLRTLYDSNFNS